MSRSTLWVAAISCLCIGYALGVGTRIIGDRAAREDSSQQRHRRPDARQPEVAAPSSPDFAAEPLDAPAVLGRGPGADTSRPRTDLQALTACARSTDTKTAEHCLQQLDAIGIQDPQVRGTFLQLISAQQDPAAKARILENITPAPLPPEDLALFLKELALVRQSPDPEVRADGLIRTAVWDHSEALAGVLRKGLYDENPEVARAAATAVLASNVRTQEIKDALLMQASDAAPDSQLHRSALEALRDFPLSRDEYAIYRMAYDRSSTDSQK